MISRFNSHTHTHTQIIHYWWVFTWMRIENKQTNKQVEWIVYVGQLFSRNLCIKIVILFR